ncbi:hypothetical protein H311_01117 [Anncaliia algerae PRA109]|uniref:Homeobox domain-containing protein n=1 Tax=Anncaliia algerae PRA339 TaxID=1288291 RepID=A0A059EZD1_9MICR|nr:hypothetical protein H311_01117 [Anncaliia algerae PRA109]KCZ80227.1 hypothetical protein H312_02377 [Anncaliia algerae PRA339]
MEEWIKELSNKLMDFKFTFVEANNNLIDKFETLNAKNMCLAEIIRPCVSNAVRDLLNSKLNSMQKAAVNAIASTFKTFQEATTPHRKSNDGLYNRRFDKITIYALEESFKKNPYPSEQEKARIQQEYGITLRQVSNWFTNKRNRSKLSSFKSSNSNEYLGLYDEYKE